MALSLSNFLISCCLFLLVFDRASAATVTYNWNITWTMGNPDGLQQRPVIGINGQWPLPLVNVTKGDQVIVNVLNQLGNQSTSIHFHGFYQNGTNHMDGPVQVTQCPIPPGSSFTYNFTANQTGTYWYHSHMPGQYPDGLRGPVVITDPENPYKGQYDEEMVVTMSDWYHGTMTELLNSFISYKNPTGAEPIPDSAVINDTNNLQLHVEPGKTYYIHFINLAAFSNQYVWFEDHQMNVVEVDGVYTESMPTDQLYITVAQRYSVMLTTKNDTSTNYAFVTSMDEDLFDYVPATLNPNTTSWLVYNTNAPLPTPSLLDSFDPLDDFTLVPYDKEPLFENPSQTVLLNFHMGDLGNGANYAFFNDVSYVSPKVPTLYSAITSGNYTTDNSIYGTYSNSFVLAHNQVIEIVVNSFDSGKHPFHLHGHNFQAVVRSPDNAGTYASNVTFPATPMRRDTFLVRPNGNIVLRFRSDNPGVWFFHCHIEWHIATGLLATMVEAPLQIEEHYRQNPLPADHLAVCAAGNVPTAGNAAGNTQNLLDLTGQNEAVSPLPAGFTAKGIVALVFSCVAGILGITVIAWYGAAPLNSVKKTE